MNSGTTVYLSLGSNMGDSKAMLTEATVKIGLRAGVIDAVSSFYFTEPWGKANQAKFINQVIQIRTTFSPIELLKTLQNIEAEMGRTRETRWGPRTLDIDILFYSSEIINLPELNIPHPRMAERNFVLVPLAEISPDLVHPLLNKKISQLVDDCKDQLQVQKIE